MLHVLFFCVQSLHVYQHTAAPYLEAKSNQTHLFDHCYHPGHEHDAGGLWRIMHAPERGQTIFSEQKKIRMQMVKTALRVSLTSRHL